MVDVYSKDCKCTLTVSSLSDPDDDPIQQGMKQDILSKKLTYHVPNVTGLVLHYLATYCRVSALLQNTVGTY